MDGKIDKASGSLILNSRPSKVVSSELTVPAVKCLLIYMDFEGRSDVRSVKTILSHMAPLKLDLVHGTAEATEHLKQHCLKHVCPHVYAPQLEETIQVQPSERLMNNIIFKKLGEDEIVWFDSEVGKTEDEMLSLIPCSTPASPHKPILGGDLKKADFKQFLADKGGQVEFAGGALRYGESATVHKVGDASHKGGDAGSQKL